MQWHKRNMKASGVYLSSKLSPQNAQRSQNGMYPSTKPQPKKNHIHPKRNGAIPSLSVQHRIVSNSALRTSHKPEKVKPTGKALETHKFSSATHLHWAQTTRYQPQTRPSTSASESEPVRTHPCHEERNNPGSGSRGKRPRKVSRAPRARARFRCSIARSRRAKERGSRIPNPQKHPLAEL